MSEVPATDPPAGPPKSLFDKLGAGLPIALTALSTIFAGMSTGELSRAMYWRSTAAQDQSKANDQWSLAGFKRDRSLVCETTAVTLRVQAGFRAAKAGSPVKVPEVVTRVRGWMTTKEPTEPPTDDPGVRDVLKAIRARQPEPDVLRLARKVEPEHLERALTDAAVQSDEVEATYDAESAAARKAATDATRAAEGGQPTDVEGRTAAVAALAHQYDADNRRYRAEATMNQWIGFLYEVRVKTSAATSDRHRHRSENFFIAMLAAQLGAVVSSLALARKQRSVLWVLAAAAGVAAVGFGGYVYLTM